MKVRRAAKPLGEEMEVLRKYDEALFRKLEEKVSELQESNTKLAQSEERFRCLFEGSAVGQSITSPTGEVSVNWAFCEMLGYAPGELQGATWQSITHPDDIAATEREALAVLLGQKTSTKFEKRFLRKNGSIAWVELASTARRDATGNPVYLMTTLVDITERKRVEEALRENEKRLDTIFRANPAAIAIARIDDNTLIDVNHAWEEQTGYSRAEAVGRTTLELNLWVCPEDRERIVRELSSAGPARVEARVRRKSGEYRTALMAAESVELAGQRCLVSMAQDVTELRRAEAAERRSDQLFRQAFMTGLDAFYLATLEDGRIIDCNSEFEGLFGYSRDEVIGKTSWELNLYLDPTDRSRVVADLKAKGCVKDFETKGRRKNGDTFVVSLSVSTLKGQDEESRILGVIRDITKLKEAEQERSFLTTMLEVAPVGVIIHDARGRLLYANQQASALHGYAPDEFLRLNLHDLLGPEHGALANSREETLANSGQSFDVEHLRKDGSRIPLHVNTRMVSWQGMPAVLSTEVDLTERRLAESERKSLEEQLQVSQKMDAIGSLAGGVAHDFNNLLCVLLNSAEFALRGLDEDNPVRNDLLAVKRAGERAAALTQQLLAFSRKQVLQPVPLAVNDVARGMASMFSRIVGEDVEFVQILDPELGVVVADHGQIEQVLMNLVVNARDAMPGGGRLTIETSNVEIDEFAQLEEDLKPGSYVQVLVTDTGCGIDEQVKARMFEPFFTTKEKGKGTGLGLSTVYGIVKQSGGGIWVESEVGKGTTFRIFLPRALLVRTTSPRLRAVPAESTGTETILLVEDEEELRKVARRSLEAAGYTVLSAADGEEALRVSAGRAGVIDLLLTDVVMPRMGGKALVQQLTKERPAIAVLYMSGYTDEAIGHRGSLAAGEQLLGKPFTGTGLTRKVREVLDGGVVAARVGHALDAGAEPEGSRPGEAALRGLPEDVVAGLRKAVLAARYDEMVAIADRLRPTSPEAAEALRQLVESFDYEGILDLLGPRTTGGTP